jgi:hypothetical protein
MKLMGLLLTLVSLIGLAGPAIAQGSTLPDSGTYFIVNPASGQALQPVGPTPGQNVLLYEFNKGGSQKWTITRKVDPITKKPTNRYTIRLAGENEGLSFQPHPVAERTAMISSGTSVFVLAPGDAGLIIKSVDRNGDALFVSPDPPGNSQAHFGPSDGSGKFSWSFIAAD